MQKFHDFVGVPFEAAKKYLDEHQIPYMVTETSSPRNDVPGKELRIVRQKLNDQILSLTLCRY